ncbi:uncharacterized protein F5891DRAFT_976338 [Suillus fuscotomentosus]|uniref:Uncharacterized protein n=1 Tax=Suillus fuscotomentosus TaxID=1912939 RepID=A0AAD4HPL0_9AGAM|nr:uncharacterized protein F5891DRAFT_976338 [Suillus fuscotomentosus]KAG1905400.1 hypothetical protein F5891DRAFT_976338 [Suillus fuscotomentosus]
MSQPNAVMQRMATRPKNATQHPGCILIESQGKRHTAAQKAADDQHEKEAKEASNKAVQESYQCIATMQAQMQADQDNAHVDTPKPKHPRACPVGKAAKTSKTPDSTMDDLEEEPVAAKSQRKKATKPLVRDVIEVLNAGVIIESFDRSTKARDANVQKLQLDIPKKISYSGRIPGWVSTVPANTSKPSSMSKVATTHPRSTTTFSKLTRGSTISSNVPPPTPISIPNAGSTFSNLYASNIDEDEELFNKPLSGFTGKKALTFQPKLQIASKALDNVFPHGATSEPDPIEDAKHAEVPSDICDQIIFMNSGIGDITPPQLAFLGDYKSDSDASHELQAADYDSDLVPPPLAQKPTSRSVFPVDYELLAASQKWKQPPLLSDDDLLSLSSDDEIMEVTNDCMITIKAEPASEPVSMHRLTSMTNIATTLKAPPVKRLKSKSSTTTITGSHRAIATPSKAIACSAFRKKHLPKGCQMANKWAMELIPTAIRCVGDLYEVWTLSDDILCPILQSAWDAVYKDKIPHTVTANGPAIALRLSEWHNSISNVALIVLANFMISQEDLDTDQDRQDFALGLLENLCFLFGDILEDGETSRPFQSDLLVQVLVQHKCAMSGAVNMPGINNTLLGHSKGTLTLITAAACIFSLLIQLTPCMLLSDIDTVGNGQNNKTPLHINLSMGKESSVPLAFSDINWGVQTRAYIMSISRLPDSVVYHNAELTHNLAMKRRGTWMEVDDQTEDERALIL